MRSGAALVRTVAVALTLVGIDVYESTIARASTIDPVLEIPREIPVDSASLMAFIVVAALSALIASSLYRAARYLRHAPAPSAEPASRTLGTFEISPSWIRAGTPIFKGTELSRSPDGKTSTGLWSCDGPGTFEWQYGCDETVCLIEGQVQVEYLRRHFTLNAGDSAVFHAGTRALWHMPLYARKVYTLHELDLLVRVWRRVVRMFARR